MEKASHPAWETALLVVSFVLLWVWFLVRHATLARHGQMSPLWMVLLVALLAGLVVVTVRRMRRVVEALQRDARPGQRPPQAGRNGHAGR